MTVLKQWSPTEGGATSGQIENLVLQMTKEKSHVGISPKLPCGTCSQITFPTFTVKEITKGKGM